jgi:hypothetical protein
VLMAASSSPPSASPLVVMKTTTRRRLPRSTARPWRSCPRCSSARRALLTDLSCATDYIKMWCFAQKTNHCCVQKMP